MNEEQRSLFNPVISAIQGRDIVGPRVFFLSAPTMTMAGSKFKASAFTAIAAALIPDGETCDAAYGIPVHSQLSGNERSYIECETPHADAHAEASIGYSGNSQNENQEVKNHKSGK